MEGNFCCFKNGRIKIKVCLLFLFFVEPTFTAAGLCSTSAVNHSAPQRPDEEPREGEDLLPTYLFPGEIMF